LVEDVIMPPIGWVLGNVDFSDLKLVLVQKSAEAEEVAIKYGAFLNTVISFIIVAFAVFILIKAINTLQAKMTKAEADAAANAAPTTKKCPYCCNDVALEATRCPFCTSELKK
jgi:large conductance mechanosensitive channel